MAFVRAQAAWPLSGADWLTRLGAEIAPHRAAIVPISLIVVPWAAWLAGPGWASPAFAVVGLAGSALLVIDERTHRLPNAITLPSAALALALLCTASLG